NGAKEVFELPLDSELLLNSIRDEVRRNIRVVTVGSTTKVEVGGWSTLRDREREIAGYVSEGLSSRDIAEILGISPRTVETHRAKAMLKMNAANTAELVRMVVT